MKVYEIDYEEYITLYMKGVFFHSKDGRRMAMTNGSRLVEIGDESLTFGDDEITLRYGKDTNAVLIDYGRLVVSDIDMKDFEYDHKITRVNGISDIGCVFWRHNGGNDEHLVIGVDDDELVGYCINERNFVKKIRTYCEKKHPLPELGGNVSLYISAFEHDEMGNPVIKFHLAEKVRGEEMVAVDGYYNVERKRIINTYDYRWSVCDNYTGKTFYL